MKNLSLGLICCLLVSCSVAPLNRTVIRQEPIKVSSSKLLNVSANKVIDAIESKSVSGKYYTGAACVGRGPLHWKATEGFLNEVTNHVRKKLEENGYSVVGKAYSPFNEEYSKQSDLILGGKIVQVDANVCYSIEGIKGEAYLKVEWQVFDTKTKNIILTLSTEGYASLPSFEKLGGDTSFYAQAFDMAIDNLLASKVFYSLLSKDNG
jgi:hypothetical protein